MKKDKDVIKKLCPRCKTVYIGKKCENCFRIENMVRERIEN